MMGLQEWCGFIASFLFTISLLPQIRKSIQTQSVEDISPVFLMIYFIASSLMLVYACASQLYPIIINNIANIISVFILLILYCYYGQNDNENRTGR